MQAFEDKLLGSNPAQKMVEKRKKDAYKALVSEAIGVGALKYFINVFNVHGKMRLFSQF